MFPIAASRAILLCARRPSNIRRAVPPGHSHRDKSTILSPVPRNAKKSGPSRDSPRLQLIPVPEVNRPIRPDTLKCWIDASTKHGLVAIVIGSTYKTFRLREGWEQPGRDQFWAEMIAFELLAQVLLACRYTGHVTIYSDSASCLGVWGGRRTTVKSVQECNERLQTARRFWSFTTRAEWVSSKINPADPFSRGKPLNGYAELQIPVAIPLALERFVHRD